MSQFGDFPRPERLDIALWLLDDFYTCSSLAASVASRTDALEAVERTVDFSENHKMPKSTNYYKNNACSLGGTGTGHHV